MTTATGIAEHWMRDATRIDPDRVRAYIAAAQRERAVYRLDPERAWRYQDQPALLAAHGDHFDLAILPALTHVVLPTGVTARLRRIGPLLRAALTTCADLIPADETSRAFVSAGEKAESLGLSARVRDTATIADWIRVDYVLRESTEGPQPVIVDINLMPGMTHTTAAVAALHRRLLLPDNPQLRDEFAALDHYDIDPIDRMRERYATTVGADTVHFVVRRGHGLEPDVTSAARSLTRRGRVRGVLTYAENLSALDNGSPVVVRQARTTTKHLDPSHSDQERAAINDLLIRAGRGDLSCYPGPHMYMESHAWPYFIATAPYAQHLRHHLGERDYATLTAALASTGIVADGRIQWASGATEPITTDSLHRRVIKRGTSTGAEGVEVLAGNRGRCAYRQRAATALTGRTEPGWVVQHYIDSRKDTHLVADTSGAIRPVTGYLRYGAYYAAGSYIGGYALLSPQSRMVHGGSATHWLTLAGQPR
ncbi:MULTISPECIES: hypothetical protein [Nocardia]|uniref:hypothetical protein n=1 Tax=Nocardia TaxID=1817 RepID=UPI002457A3C1|nr:MULTISPECIES: hypothetical protein [Nocardia]